MAICRLARRTLTGQRCGPGLSGKDHAAILWPGSVHDWSRFGLGQHSREPLINILLALFFAIPLHYVSKTLPTRSSRPE